MNPFMTIGCIVAVICWFLSIAADPGFVFDNYLWELHWLLRNACSLAINLWFFSSGASLFEWAGNDFKINRTLGRIYRVSFLLAALNGVPLLLDIISVHSAFRIFLSVLLFCLLITWSIIRWVRVERSYHAST